VRAPEISVVCECGEQRSLPYGARWECETCGRRWNTAQIPAEDYQRVERAVRRYRLEAFGFAAIILAVFAPLMILVDVRLGITGLILFFAWAFLFRPRQRRRLVAAAREGARWQLRPE
jgi:hypothetical protein